MSEGKVRVVTLPMHFVDDRGSLVEVFRCDEPSFENFGQVYIVEDFTAGTIRGFHRHFKMWDVFFIARGAAKFLFVDAGLDEPPDPSGNVYAITTAASKPTRLDVPPGVWHGWKALVDGTLLVSIASEPYMGKDRKGELDEERVGPYFFHQASEMWQTEFK